MTEENRRLIPEGGVTVDKYRLFDSNDVSPTIQNDHYLYSIRNTSPEAEGKNLLIEDCFREHRVWSAIYAFEGKELIGKVVLTIPLLPEQDFEGDKDFMHMQFAGNVGVEGTKKYAEVLGYIREYLFVNNLATSLRVYAFASETGKTACVSPRRSGFLSPSKTTVVKTDLLTNTRVIRIVIGKEAYLNGTWKTFLTNWKAPSIEDIILPGEKE